MPKPKRVRETTNPLGKKLNQVMAFKGLAGDYAAVAKHFGVAVPSVYGWVDFGRISKARFGALEDWSDMPVAWWLDDSETEAVDQDTRELHNALEDWRLQASARSLVAIDLLTAAAKKNKLRDEDWHLIEQLALRFSQK